MNPSGRHDADRVTVVICDLPEVRRARAYVRERCDMHKLGADACEIALLLTSEVVTNALTHGRSVARVTATVAGRNVRVEVSDDNSRHPRIVDADENALDGRGLTILDRLATAWGVLDDAYGKTVWFDITCLTT